MVLTIDDVSMRLNMYHSFSDNLYLLVRLWVINYYIALLLIQIWKTNKFANAYRKLCRIDSHKQNYNLEI